MLDTLALTENALAPRVDTGAVVIRLIRPDDESRLAAFFRALSPAARNRRFLAVMNDLPPALLARFARPDNINEVALVATTSDGERESVIGEARFVVDDTRRRNAEFALVVTDTAQRSGLGERLVRSLVRRAAAARIECLYGEVLPGNHAMLSLARKLGFRERRDPLDPRLLRVEKCLDVLRLA